MKRIKGYNEVVPRIETVRFPKGKVVIYLVDGRIIIIPISRFPEIKRLSVAQRRKYKTLAGTGLMFDDLDTVFRISDFMGEFRLGKEVKINKAAEPPMKYKKSKR